LHKVLRLLLPGLTLLAVSAYADTFTFTFDPLASGTLSTGGGNTATSSIQGYMQSLLKTGETVTVTGAVADKTYNGEGYVVGPGSNKGNVTPLTLGNTNGATSVSSNSAVNRTYDTFIANTNDGGTQISSQIVMQFTGLTINGTVSFDYEIFPDVTGQTPDLTFAAGPTGHTSNIFTYLGVKPGSGYDQSTGSTMDAKISKNNNPETNAQLIGHWSGTINNATELDFIDCPATIGIDNLVITTSTVPEPASFLLFGTLAAGTLLLVRRRRAVR